MNFREQIELAESIRDSIRVEDVLPHAKFARLGLLVPTKFGSSAIGDIQTVMDVRIRELELLEQVEKLLKRGLGERRPDEVYVRRSQRAISDIEMSSARASVIARRVPR